MALINFHPIWLVWTITKAYLLNQDSENLQKRCNAQYKLASAEWVWLIDIDDHYRMCRQILCKHDREDGATVGDAILWMGHRSIFEATAAKIKKIISSTTTIQSVFVSVYEERYVTYGGIWGTTWSCALFRTSDMQNMVWGEPERVQNGIGMWSWWLKF